MLFVCLEMAGVVIAAYLLRRETQLGYVVGAAAVSAYMLSRSIGLP